MATGFPLGVFMFCNQTPERQKSKQANKRKKPRALSSLIHKYDKDKPQWINTINYSKVLEYLMYKNSMDI
jgi:hypothetical protein